MITESHDQVCELQVFTTTDILYFYTRSYYHILNKVVIHSAIFSGRSLRLVCLVRHTVHCNIWRYSVFITKARAQCQAVYGRHNSYTANRAAWIMIRPLNTAAGPFRASTITLGRELLTLNVRFPYLNRQLLDYRIENIFILLYETSRKSSFRGFQSLVDASQDHSALNQMDNIAELLHSQRLPEFQWEYKLGWT